MPNKKEPIYINGVLHSKCIKCSEVKHFSEFYKAPYAVNGLGSSCKNCVIRLKSRGVKKKIKFTRTCKDCSGTCDGTLQLLDRTVCSKCFDKMIYGKDPLPSYYPSRSSMLL